MEEENQVFWAQSRACCGSSEADVNGEDRRVVGLARTMALVYQVGFFTNLNPLHPPPLAPFSP